MKGGVEMKNKIYFGNSIEVATELPKNTYDLILTDPPYNASGKKVSWESKNWEKINESWDTFTFEGYINFTQQWIEAVDPLLKETGMMMICCSQHNIGEIILELKKRNYKFLNIITWKKTNPMPNVTRRTLTHSTEFILWFAKGKNYTFNYEEMKKYNDGKQLKDVWEFPLCQGKERIKKIDSNKSAHPTQKPLDLINRLIEMGSKEGDLILDPFFGSGTTGESALLLNRSFTGIEANEEYYKVASERIKKIDKNVE